jgi:hypothetical protein
MDGEKQSQPDGKELGPPPTAAQQPAAASSQTQSEADLAQDADKTSSGKGWRFWAIFPALCITTLLAAVEVTVVSTALPFIVHELGIGDSYVWILNAYLLTR